MRCRKSHSANWSFKACTLAARWTLRSIRRQATIATSLILNKASLTEKDRSWLLKQFFSERSLLLVASRPYRVAKSAPVTDGEEVVTHTDARK